MIILKRSKRNRKKWMYPIAVVSILLFLFCVMYLTLRKSPEISREEYKKFIAHHPYSVRPHYTNEELRKVPRSARPDLAFEQDYLSTLDPNLGYVPYERRLKAFKETKDRLKLKSAIPGINWTERGPNNMAGRTRAVMFDPNDSQHKKVWAGGVTGGLWYTDDITDENASWYKINDFWENITIASMAYDPNNTNIFYVGTGESYTGASKGAGIWKSADGGDTWNQIDASEDFYYVNDIVVRNEDDTSVLYAAVDGRYYQGDWHGEEYAGLWRSVNGGASFTQVMPELSGGQSYAPSDIEIGSDNRIWIGTNNNPYNLPDRGGGAILYSDTGTVDTWHIAYNPADGDRVELACAPSDSNIVYAVIEHDNPGDLTQDVLGIYKTENHGGSWSSLTIPLYREQNGSVSTSHFTRSQAGYDLILAVHPSHPDTVIIGGIDLHKSEDGGTTWFPISYWTGKYYPYVHADLHNIQFRPENENQAAIGSDGGMAFSFDIGNSSTPSFITRNKDYNVTQFYTCAAANIAMASNFLGGTQDNGTLQFNKYGVGPSVEVTGGDGGYCFIDQNEPDTQIASYIYNNYYVSTDGGNSFTQFADNDDDGRFINPAAYDDDANILYAAGDTSQWIRYSNIGGAVTTTPIPIALDGAQITTIRANLHTANDVLIGTNDGRVYKIQDAHASPSFSMISDDGLFPVGTVSSIDVGASDDEIFVALSNYGIKSIWYTDDGGTTWTSKDESTHGLPDMPVRCILCNPDDTKQVLIATEIGVWSTSDITASDPDWEPSKSGLANVRCDMLRYREADGLVIIATFGRGLFSTDIFASPAADFIAERKIGYLNDVISFTDGSLGATSWSWTFGDGGSSTDQNPSHTYTGAGSYTVTLEINSGALTETKTNYITIMPNKGTPYTTPEGGDFESNTYHFASEAIAGNYDVWERGVPSGVIDSAASPTDVWKTLLNNFIIKADYSSALYTPSFNFTANGTYYVKFKYRMDVEYYNAPFAVWMEYSNDGGESWNRLGDDTGNPAGTMNWYNLGPGSTYQSHVAPDSICWAWDYDIYTQAVYNASDLTGNDDVRFRWVAMTETGWSDGYDMDGFAIDDFEIEGPANDPKGGAISPPTFISAATNTEGTMIEATFSKDMADPTGKHAEFTVNSGGNNPVTGINLKSGDNTTLQLTPTNTILYGEAVTLSYTKGSVESADGGILESFGPSGVTNSVITLYPLLSTDNVFTVYPNPSNGQITIHIKQNLGAVWISIYTVNGKLVYSDFQMMQSDEQTWDINLEVLSKGIYSIYIQNDRMKYRQSFLLQ